MMTNASFFHINADNMVITMPTNIPIVATYRLCSNSDLICFLKPIKNPVDDNTIILQIANKIANFLILSNPIAMRESTPENRPIIAVPANPSILCDHVNLKQLSSSSCEEAWKAKSSSDDIC